jgi:hypothetical protein
MRVRHALHRVDEHVFEVRLRLFPHQLALGHVRLDGAPQRHRSSPVTRSVLPNAVTCTTPGFPLSSWGSCASRARGPHTCQVSRLKTWSTSSGVPVASSLP